MLFLPRKGGRSSQALGLGIALSSGAVAVGATVARSPMVAIGASFGFVILSLTLGRTTRVSWSSVAIVAGWALSVFVAEDGLFATFSVPKMAPLALMGGGAAVMFIRRPPVRNFPEAGRWAVSYVGWLSVCALLSEAPALSLLRVVQAGLPVFVALVLFTRCAGHLSLILGVGAACVAHVVWATLHPVYVGNAGAERLIGRVIANTFGLACGLVIVILVGLWLGRLIPRCLSLPSLGVAVLGVYGITASIGRTASIGVPIAVCASMVASRSRRDKENDSSANRRRKLLAASICVCGVIALSSAGGVLRWFETGNQEIGSLTGRTTLWRVIAEAVGERPFVGYGPGAMRFGVSSMPEALQGRASLGQSHNSFFEALLSGGLFGAALWLGMMAALVRQVMLLGHRFRPVAAGVLALLMVASITLGNMAGFGVGWFALISLLCVDPAPVPSEKVGDGPPCLGEYLAAELNPGAPGTAHA